MTTAATATSATRRERGYVTLTADRGYFAPVVAGETRRLTPEGFLICEDVAIARTGEQVYSAYDLPNLQPDADGKIIVSRSPDEVFAEETIASFEGKPVTLSHPTEFMTPENWKTHAVGHIQNVHRGEGAESDLLKGDIVLTDAAAVAYATRALPDISCGYDAQYKQLGPGRAAQSQIRGNHAALVPNGRAGDRCAIKDSATTELSVMSKTLAGPAVDAGWLQTMCRYVDWKFKELVGRGRGMRVGDDVLTSNLPARKSYEMGKQYPAGSAEGIRDRPARAAPAAPEFRIGRAG